MLEHTEKGRWSKTNNSNNNNNNNSMGIYVCVSLTAKRLL